MWAVRYMLLPAALLLVPLLAWMLAEPIWRRWREQLRRSVPTPVLPPPEATLSLKYRRIALALEAGPQDPGVLAGVIPLIRAAGAEVVLIHVVESAVARFLGETVDDEEARSDADYLERVAESLRAAELVCITRLGAGDPAEEIARLAEQEHSDLIVTGAHGHRFLGDLFHGSTVNDLRHLTNIPVLTIRGAAEPLPAAWSNAAAQASG